MTRLTALYSLLIASACLFGGKYIFKQLGILDRPGSDLKNTRKPVPTILGVFVMVALIGILALLFPQYFAHRIVQGLLVGSGIIFVVQLLDELHYMGRSKLNLPSRVRLLSHIIAAISAVVIGGLGGQEIVIGAWKWIMPQWAFIVAFVFWSLACINAINWFDGIYAQASGVSAIGFFTLGLLLKYVVFGTYTVYLGDSKEVLLIVQNLAFIFALLSFITSIIEFKPLALVRDVGIMVYGFALAYLSIAGGAKIGTILVTLSLVLLDWIWVVGRRIIVMKKNPLSGDFTHWHHRLMGLGRTRPEIRAFVWIWSAVMMVFMLLQGTDRIGKVIIFVIVASIFLGVNWYLFVTKKLPCGLGIKKEI